MKRARPLHRKPHRRHRDENENSVQDLSANRAPGPAAR